jgi:hypothetical protein
MEPRKYKVTILIWVHDGLILPTKSRVFDLEKKNNWISKSEYFVGYDQKWKINHISDNAIGQCNCHLS